MLPQAELYRPRYHFTPPQMWMNDPNGLVYYKGEYHLFYQYHPASNIWGPMHWGHAVSRDLVNWQHLPVALYPDENGMIFSGSAVVDKNNSAGFGEETMVSIFTHHKADHQSQSLAYSTDSGRTWTKYLANPVLFAKNDSRDFRDPKVFWYGEEETGHWVMCLAARDRILFYISSDLIHWTLSGKLGPGFGSTVSVWETPELFELSTDNGQETRWVLTVGVQDGSPAGGSGTQYFVGTFDGRNFTSENPPGTVQWLDHGADYYAAQSWNDEPNRRRLIIAWMNNWQYANAIPASDSRGTFSLIRELSLQKTEAGLRIIHQPIPEMRSLRNKHHHWQKETLTPGKNLLENIEGNSLEILAEFQITNQVDRLGFHVRVGTDERTTIGYSAKEKKVFVDRTHAGQGNFHDGFARVHFAPLNGMGDLLRLHIFVDQCSVEVFANDGLVVMTDCIFPSPESAKLEMFVEGGKALLNSLDVFPLSSAQFIHKEVRS